MQTCCVKESTEPSVSDLSSRPSGPLSRPSGGGGDRWMGALDILPAVNDGDSHEELA